MQEVRDEQLIVFTRYPEPGSVKTRLIPALGEERATALHRWMAMRTRDAAKTVVDRRSVSLVTWFTGGSKDAMAAWLGGDLVFEAQGDGDLGRRLCRAFEASFATGYRRVVAIGTDCPGLTGASIEEAFDRLKESDLVLGPAEDGGYYLIGLSRHLPGIFDAVPWGTDRVLAQTRRIAEDLRVGISMLGPLRDIDRPEDLDAARVHLEDWRMTERGATE